MTLTPREEAEYLALLEADRLDRIRQSLHAYCRYIDIPGAPLTDDEDCDTFYTDTVTPAKHHDLLNGLLMRLADRDDPLDRLMVFMPPGSAKSTYATVTFPTWYMGNNANEPIICASYGTSLARKFGRKCRQITASAKYARLFGCSLRPDHRAVEDWSLTNGSSYLCGGLLSGLTGNRARGIVIDDPVRGREDADSPTLRDKTWDAYQDDLRTRLKPGGWQLVIQTRWHEDDLSGRILPETWDGESGWVTSRQGERWYVLALEAECTRPDDPLGRQIGEYLWTDWFSPAHWEQEKRAGSRRWASLYQQRPKPSEGALIQRAWVQRYRTQPAAATVLRIVQSWDTAYKDSQINDPAACTTWAETRTGWYLLHVHRDRMAYPALKRAVASLAEQWHPHAILIEDKSSGQSLIQEMRGRFTQPVVAIEPAGSKLDRLVAVSSLIEGGLVHLPEHAPWLVDYEAELFGYPLTTHDDQIDSTSQALAWMSRHRGRYDHHASGRTRTGLAADTPTARDPLRGFF